MRQLNKRQEYILLYISNHNPLSTLDVIKEVDKRFDKTSKPTILRDLGVLQKNGQIIKKGFGPAVVYEPKTSNPLLRHFGTEAYFEIPSDKREIKKNFNWGIFDNPEEIFSEQELKKIKTLNAIYLKKKSKLPVAALKKEIERITIELSWKSSELEGNTYTLLDTEALLKEALEAPGHSREEKNMILNHKKALDYIFSCSKNFKKIKSADIRAVHSILVRNLGVPDDFRKILVRITGTDYRPLDNQHQIKEAMDRLAEKINSTVEPIAKALLAVTLLSYIQPFVDGNKRISRLMANALLIAHDWCPMSLRSMDAAEYKKAIILFYEQNSLAYFKELFVKQFEFAVENYFG